MALAEASVDASGTGAGDALGATGDAPAPHPHDSSTTLAHAVRLTPASVPVTPACVEARRSPRASDHRLRAASCAHAVRASRAPLAATPTPPRQQAGRGSDSLDVPRPGS